MGPPPGDVKHPDKNLRARGLDVYISDIRKCATHEEERERVMRECANIRAKFASTSSSSHGSSSGSSSSSNSGRALSSYDRRKYVWKLLYTYMLGYDVDFGYMHALELAASESYQEKLCGYMALSTMLRNTDPLMTLMVNTLKKDLAMHVDDAKQCLALITISNVGGATLASALSEDVRRLVADPMASIEVRKKGLLTLLRLARDEPEAVTLPTEQEVALFFQSRHAGICLAASALLLHIVRLRRRTTTTTTNVTGKGQQQQREDDEEEDDEDAKRELLQTQQRPYVQALVVHTLYGLAVSKTYPADYDYHDTSAPWLQVALLRVLRAMRTVPPTEEIRNSLFLSLTGVLKGVRWSKMATTNNASRCAALEAIALVALYEGHARQDMVRLCLDLLERFAASKNANTRYLALTTMLHIAQSSVEAAGGDASESRWWNALKQREGGVLDALRSADATVHRRALDLVYCLCHDSNAPAVVESLLDYLRTNTEMDDAMREEMVLRLAILAERYARDPRWYLDTALALIDAGGDSVGPYVWHRVAQVVVNQDDVQRYAALAVYKQMLLSPAHVSEAAVSLAAYVLGEFGYLLNTDSSTLAAGELDHDVSSADLFGAMHRHYANASPAAKGVLLSAYCKLLNIYGDLNAPVSLVFREARTSANPELQQRACEYLRLSQVQEDKMHAVLEPIPPWSASSKVSALVRRLAHSSAHEAEMYTSSSSSVVVGTTRDEQQLQQEKEKEKDEAQKQKLPEVYDSDEDAALIDVMGDDEEEEEEEEGEARYAHYDDKEGGSSDEDGGANQHHDDSEDDDEEEGDGSFTPMNANQTPPTTGIALAKIATTTPKPELEARKQFLNALLSPKSLLFDDGAMQVGTQQEFRAFSGTVTLFVGNLSGDASLVLDDVQVLDTVSPPRNAALQCVKQNCSHNFPAEVLPHTQLQMVLAVECIAPFMGSPSIEIHARSASVPVTLRLPVAATSFADPVAMNAMDFEQRWTALEKRGGIQNVETIEHHHQPWSLAIEKLEKCMLLLRLGRVAGWPSSSSSSSISTTTNTFDGAYAATFRTSTPHPTTREPSSIGFLVRLEIDEHACAARFSVRAAHASVAAVIHPILVNQVLRLFRMDP